MNNNIIRVNYTPLSSKMLELHSPPFYVKIYTPLPLKVKFILPSLIRYLNYNPLS